MLNELYDKHRNINDFIEFNRGLYFKLHGHRNLVGALAGSLFNPISRIFGKAPELNEEVLNALPTENIKAVYIDAFKYISDGFPLHLKDDPTNVYAQGDDLVELIRSISAKNRFAWSLITIEYSDSSVIILSDSRDIHHAGLTYICK